MRTRYLSRELDDTHGIAHPGPPPFGHISQFGPIFHDRPGSWRPREIDSLGPIGLRPFEEPRLGRKQHDMAEPMPRQQWDAQGPVEL